LDDATTVFTAITSWRVRLAAAIVGMIVCGAYLYGSVDRPREVDEMIDVTLAHRLSLDPSTYTLRGTPVLDRLAQDVYDVPLFHHPPLVPLLLRGLYEACPLGSCEGVSRNFTLLPILAHLLTVALLWVYWGRGRTKAERRWPVLLLLLSPIAAFIATKVWLDTILALLFFLTVSLYHFAVEERQARLFLLAGVSLGLTLLTKFTGFLLLPILLSYHLAKLGASRRSWQLLGAAALPAILLAGPWFVLFYSTYSMLVPNWIRPTAEMMEKFPFVATIVHRSPFYYLQILVALMPATLAAGAVIHRRFREKDSILLVAVVVVVLSAFTYIGMEGGGYQTRHILPAVPFLCLLAGRSLSRMGKVSQSAAVITLLFGLWNLHGNVYSPRRDTAAELQIFVPGRSGSVVLTNYPPLSESRQGRSPR
jgi:4-amino-4-deoxy-L-arabinose transferase-like glycosyltransferase